MISHFSRFLSNATLWELSRYGLEKTIGLYSRRLRVLREWGVLDGAPSVIDLGCGIGQYSRVTRGPYLGVDLHPGYIAHAARANWRPGTSFRCVDATRLLAEGSRYDVGLMVDFLHHLSEESAVTVLRTMGGLSRGSIINFEPVREQTNPIGRWIISNDRGDYIRTTADLLRLFERAGLGLVECRRLRIGPIRTVAILARGDEDARAIPHPAEAAKGPHVPVPRPGHDAAVGREAWRSEGV
jgi:SAM-dependent methyltransferase